MADKSLLIATNGQRCHVLGARHKDDLTRLVDLAIRTFGRIDVVINNSGNPHGGEIVAITDEYWTEIFEMYFLSIVRMARLVTPIMVRQRHGSIVNISGSDANEPDSRFPVAGTLRASMSAFRKLYSWQYARSGVRMNCLMPNVVYDFDPDSIREDIRNEIPMGRPANYREVARAALFLASDEASYITGHGLRLDGGAGRAL
jgi:NAD(P)-dependent dehydrogenase (short-subunit alcohol dehydrogenase family)